MLTITLLKFSRDGAYLAIGLDSGFIHVSHLHFVNL